MTNQHLNGLFLLLILLSLTFVYRMYLDKQRKTHETDYSEIRKYLLGANQLIGNKKPILWIYLPDEIPEYLHLTVKSIIKHCDKSFTICMFDDSTFYKLLPNWKINVKALSVNSVAQEQTRLLAIMKLIHMYGGMLVPIEFLCFRNLLELYEKGMSCMDGSKMFVCETVNQTLTQDIQPFTPDIHFMGAEKENKTVGEVIELLQRLISTDNTQESTLNDVFGQFFSKHACRIISGLDIGTKTLDETPVLIDHLMLEPYLKLRDGLSGLWIPHKQLLERIHFSWFAHQTKEELLKGTSVLAKYFMVALTNGLVID